MEGLGGGVACGAAAGGAGGAAGFFVETKKAPTPAVAAVTPPAMRAMVWSSRQVGAAVRIELPRGVASGTGAKARRSAVVAASSIATKKLKV